MFWWTVVGTVAAVAAAVTGWLLLQRDYQRAEVRGILTYGQDYYDGILELLQTGKPEVWPDHMVQLRAHRARLAELFGKGAARQWDRLLAAETAAQKVKTADGTRDLSNAILPGVTRRIMLDAMAEAQVKVVERKFTLAEALKAREAFISSATGAAVPVVTIDGQKIGNGSPGAVTRRIHDLYATKVGMKTV